MNCRTVIFPLFVAATIFATELVAFSQEFDPEKLLDPEKIRPRGEYYEATVPDTLDLAERASLSVNALTGIIDPDNQYTATQQFAFLKNPPEASWQVHHQWKHARALPLMRTMCGSDQNLEVEIGLMRHCLRSPLVIEIWHNRDGNDEWLNLIEEYRDNYKEWYSKTVFQVDDRAYTPPEGRLNPDGSWSRTDRGPDLIPYIPPEEPISDQQGVEGAVKWSQVKLMRELLRCHEYTGDQGSLELARKFARFILKPSMWETYGAEFLPGSEHGVWAGHWHANITTLYSLLELANIENEEWLRQFVREGYHWAVGNMVLRAGFTPMWTEPERFNRDAWLRNCTEPCGTADTVLLAVKLTDAGLGDYWDDVDYIVRNHLAEEQVTDLDMMRKYSGNDPKNDEILKRFLGGFGGTMPMHHYGDIWGCCTANGPMGFYYAWHGITRFDGHTAVVNLFLNRAAPWLDIDSYLPYEGKVVIRNKQAKSIKVRIPHWIPMSGVKAFVNETPREPSRFARYLEFDRLNMDDAIRLEFSVPEYEDRYTIDGKEYTFFFRGSTIVEVRPVDGEPENVGKPPIFQREYMKATQAPLKKVQRFVADTIIPLP